MEQTTKQHEANLIPADHAALLEALNKSALVAMTDAKGDIIYANDYFAQISKYSLDELLGQNHRILKSGQMPESVYGDMWETISNGKIWRGDIKNKAKDGSYYWVDAVIAPIMNKDGKPERYVAIRFVITDKKKAEEDLREQIKNLEIINRAIVDRELKMVELKEKIKKLESQTQKGSQ